MPKPADLSEAMFARPAKSCTLQCTARLQLPVTSFRRRPCYHPTWQIPRQLVNQL